MSSLLEHFEIVDAQWDSLTKEDYIALAGALADVANQYRLRLQSPKIEIRIYSGNQSATFHPFDFNKQFQMDSTSDRVQISASCEARNFSLICSLSGVRNDCWLRCSCPNLSTVALEATFKDLRRFIQKLYANYPIITNAALRTEAEPIPVETSNEGKNNENSRNEQAAFKPNPRLFHFKTFFKKIPGWGYVLLTLFFSAVCAIAAWDGATIKLEKVWSLIFG